MSSHRMGVVRDSMLTNPLMTKVSLGQSRSRGFLLPGPDFTFGTSSSLMQNGGVAEVLSSWRVQPRGEAADPHKVLVPDFVSLNRNAVKAGLVTSNELRQYRAQVGGGKTKHPAPKLQEGGASQKLVVPDITTRDVSVRPASPLSHLLSHQYAHRWKEEQLSRIQTSNHNQQLRTKPGSDTRTSLLRRSRPLPVLRSQVTWKHFNQVPPAVSSFRDQQETAGGSRGNRDQQGADPAGTSRGQQGPTGTSRDQQGTAGTSRDQQGAAGTNRDHQEPEGPSKDQQGPTGTNRDQQGATGSSRNQQGPTGTSRGHQGAAGSED
ncbi:cilia- and flagella-associated protein 77 [Platichthys flesus]|uniref:cilia- and flagella-associated protein 77 n=1 Tax=Platichthys flesus TaxID=8260 RepID=UPI002DBC9863|nr:cilia- and flagella-associated protein 77 [Platichthys flesus]